MGTTINSYSVGLGMDASGYIDGAKISRSETRQLIKDIEGARTPTEQFAREQDRLTDALNKGAISQEVYSRLLEKKRSSLLGVTEATKSQTSGISALASSMLSGASAVYVFSAGFSAISSGINTAISAGTEFISYLREVQNQIDDTIDAAGKLGLSFNEISSLRFASKMGGGVDSQTTDDSIKKMMVNTAKAVDGDEGVREAFAKLGLDAGEMMKKGPVDAFMEIAEAMQGIDSQAEKLRITMEIFGKSGTDLVSTLDQGADAIQDAIAFHEKWNSLTEMQTTSVAANNDAWDEVSVVVGGISTKLSAEFAPAMLLIAESILGIADGTESVDGYMTTIVDNVVYMSGALVNNLHLLQDFAIVAGKIASLNFTGAATDAAAALGKVNLDGGEKALQALYDKRLELEQAAKNNEEEREKKRQAMLATEIDMKETASEKAAKAERERDVEKAEREEKFAEAERERDLMRDLTEQERERDLAEKKKQDFLELSVKEANKFFEDEKKKDEARRKEIAKGPGSGMELGSAEAAKYMADQVNAAIGDTVVPENANPTQEQLVQEAGRQSIILEDANRKAEEQVKKLDELIEIQRANGWRRVT